MTRARFFLGVASASLLLVTAAHAEKVTRDVDLTGFNEIDISGVFEIDVTVGDDFSIELSGEEDEMARVTTSVKNGVLHLGREKGKKRWNMKRDEHGIKATISMPSLSAFDVSGVVEGKIAGIDADAFDLELSGVGDISLAGECGALDADVSGVGDLDARDLECRDVEIDVSGVGSASVFASESVAAEVSGMGDIDVYGSPSEVRKESSMFADVTVH